MKCILPAPLVRLVDDDNDFRESQKAFLTALGWQVEDWESPAAFLQDDDLQRPGCAVLDIRMPGMTGLDLQKPLAGDFFDRARRCCNGGAYHEIWCTGFP